MVPGALRYDDQSKNRGALTGTPFISLPVVGCVSGPAWKNWRPNVEASVVTRNRALAPGA